jgi:hypothetical protein
MSATDWYICPKCRKNAIKYIDGWYGKVNVIEWELLSKFRIAWDEENTSFKVPTKAQKIFDAISEKFEDFEEHQIIMEDTIVTLRYDSDSGISSEGTLGMHESYCCQCCDFSIEVNKSWKEGVNQEVVKNDI